MMSSRKLDDGSPSLMLPHSRHFARLRSSMQHSLHQHRKMLLQAAAVVDATRHTSDAVNTAAAAGTGPAAIHHQQQQQQQKAEQQQQMVAEFMEEGHNSVNALLIEQFQPPENETAVEQGVQKPGSMRKGLRLQICHRLSGAACGVLNVCGYCSTCRR